MKYIVVFITLVVLYVPINAQKYGLTFALGPAINLYRGTNNSDFSYSKERMNYQFNGQFGFISTRGGTNRGNMLGIFGSVGSTKSGVIVLMEAEGAELEGAINTDKTFNEFYTVEAGMIIARILRLSGGVGSQFYSYDTDKKGELKFYSGTLGLAFNLGVVNWVIDANLMTGGDMNQNALRFSTGFIVKF